MLEKIQVWFRNASIVHHVAMAKFLRRRGWVVFYLDEANRECKKGSCWLRLYKDGLGSDG